MNEHNFSLPNDDNRKGAGQSKQLTKQERTIQQFIDADDELVRISPTVTLTWPEIRQKTVVVFESSCSEFIRAIFFAAVQHIYLHTLQHSNLIPQTNRDLVGLCVSKLFATQEMTRNQIKIAIRYVCMAMVEIAERSVLGQIQSPHSSQWTYLEQPAHLGFSLSQSIHFCLYKKKADPQESYQIIQSFKKLLHSKHKFCAYLFMHHAIAERTFSEIANVFGMSQSVIEEFWEQSLQKLDRQHTLLQLDQDYLGMGI